MNLNLKIKEIDQINNEVETLIKDYTVKIEKFKNNKKSNIEINNNDWIINTKKNSEMLKVKDNEIQNLKLKIEYWENENNILKNNIVSSSKNKINLINYLNLLNNSCIKDDNIFKKIININEIKLDNNDNKFNSNSLIKKVDNLISIISEKDNIIIDLKNTINNLKKFNNFNKISKNSNKENNPNYFDLNNDFYEIKEENILTPIKNINLNKRN